MTKLYMYSYKNGVISKEVFDTEIIKENVYMPIGEDDKSFHEKYNAYPPIPEDLNYIPEVAERNGYTMFSLTEDDNAYKEKLCLVLKKELDELENLCKHYQMEIEKIQKAE